MLMDKLLGRTDATKSVMPYDRYRRRDGGRWLY